MKVVFLKDIPSVAKAGDVKEVAAGYWRNYLAPKKLAEPATDEALKRVERLKKKQERETAHGQEHVKQWAQSLEGKRVTVRAKASEEGHLFGGIHQKEIVEALSQQGLTIEKAWVELEHPLKTVGEHQVMIRLPQGKRAMIVVEVMKEEV